MSNLSPNDRFEPSQAGLRGLYYKLFGGSSQYRQYIVEHCKAIAGGACDSAIGDLRQKAQVRLSSGHGFPGFDDSLAPVLIRRVQDRLFKKAVVHPIHVFLRGMQTVQ